MKPVVLFLGAALLVAQPAFEVASIKPTPPATRIIGDLSSYPGGRVLAVRCSVELLVEEALNAQPFQVSGGPGWIHEEYFDIDARPPVSSVSSKSTLSRVQIGDEQRQMLLALLAERFQLQFHRETKEGQVYFLVRTKKKLRLVPSDGDNGWPWVGSPKNGMISGDGIAGKNISMPVMAQRLSGYMRRPVLDRTGIDGSFDFRFEYAPDEPRPDIVSSILMSVQQIGLKLEAGKGPVEMIVIDRVEKLAAN